MPNANAPKVLGTCDNITSCEECGRDNLKRTVALEYEDAGIRYLGTQCAANATGRSKAYTQRKAKGGKVTPCTSATCANVVGTKWIFPGRPVLCKAHRAAARAC